ncbi:hypothetical protein T10_3882 [Trichinella papuae]|uniref:Uncharacterized protein n=1 Tax=Trichinella papuae TaxID=268474 RepID=A0A0V1M124_9BILA|nr:hypothetical protein T10_3882 [Trichinella papuae]
MSKNQVFTCVDRCPDKGAADKQNKQSTSLRSPF